MKRNFLFLITGTLFLAFTSGAQTNKKTAVKKSKTATEKAEPAFVQGENGLDYKFIVKGTQGPTANTGDIVEVAVTQKIGDSLVYSTEQANNGKPMTFPLPASQVKGELLDGLLMMRAGDSAVFRSSLDTLVAKTRQPRPEWAKEGAYITWAVKMVSIKSKEQAEAEALEKNKEQAETDERLIKELLQSKGITNAVRTASGLYYVIHNEGTGEKPVTGQKVTVNYTGVNLQGETFDSNVDSAFHHVEPFTFELGRRQVIAGWDEGIALLKKGAKATLYIPSALAYGPTARGPQIPANAILIFDVELLNFE